jgi:hypothetical protein
MKNSKCRIGSWTGPNSELKIQNAELDPVVDLYSC